MNEKEKILLELKKLTKNRQCYLVKEKLNNIDKKIKGIVFEEYLEFLFEGNGFIATIKGGAYDGGADILLSRPNNPNKIIWIVQAKNILNPLGNHIIREELKKFEEEASRKYNCNYFMIISVNGYVEKINIFNKTNMSLESFDYIEELINNYSDNIDEVILLPDLRPHNRYTYKEIKAVFEKNNRVAVPNATGTGKSYIILQLLFDYIKEDKIILAPTNEILDRLKTLAPWSVKKCKFYTYSKFSSLYFKGKLNDLKIKLIVLDELHRAGAEKWGQAVKYILNENKEAKVVGLSATPIRFLDDNRDMIKELLHGNSTTPLGLSDAIVRRILPMPVYVSAMYNLDIEIDKKLKLMKKLNISKSDKEEYINELNLYKKLWERENNIENIIKKHLPKGKRLKFIVFCENNKHLKEMKEVVVQWFENILSCEMKVSCYTVTSEKSNSKEILEAFERVNDENQVKLLFAISKLNEGIHIKDISGIIMLRNTKSPSIYYQQLGRCLSSDYEGDSPVVFDFVDNIDNLELINFRKKLEVSTSINNIYRHQLGLEDYNIRFSLYEEHENIIYELKNIERKITYNWEKSFESLLKFKEVNNHLNVPKNLEYSRLYSWVNLQRTLYKKQILGEEFVEKLNSIGFIWDINFYNWKENYKKYEELIANSDYKEIYYYKIIDDNYFIPIYKYESLNSYYENNSLVPEKDFIIRWMDKQIKEFISGNLEEKRTRILIREFREISRFEENKWISSICNIMKFYRFVKKDYGIDCYLKRVAPDKSNLIKSLELIYTRKNIIEKTVEKNLPATCKSLNFKYENDEWNSMAFIVNLIQDRSFDELKDEFIDELNSIYFKDIIDMYESNRR